MGKRKRRPGKRFKWSEAELRVLIADMTAHIHTGPQGAPGAQGMAGPMGPPGQCMCYQPLRAPWQTPLVTYADDNSPSMMDGGRGYTDTSIHVSHDVTVGKDTYEGLSAVSVGYTCNCTWVGLSHEKAPERCPSHLDGWRK